MTTEVRVQPDRYVAVAASQTDTVLSVNRGDSITGVLVKPATTSPGAVTLTDGSTGVVIFPGGSSSVASLVPFFIPFPAKCSGLGWKVTTGANVSVVVFGSFS